MWLYLFSTFGFLRDRFLSFDQDDDLVGVIVYVKGLGRPQSLKVKSPTPWLDCRFTTYGFIQWCPQVFILGLILRGTVGRQGEDLSQESLLHPQGPETETNCLSDQSPFHSGQLLLEVREEG
nr:hypothetical protein CFP56_15514 [Quercus suber]